jgi:hypothetical protein
MADVTSSGFRPEARGAADDDMQTYQGTEVGGWVERYWTGTHSISQNIACETSDVAGWPNLLEVARETISL